MNENKNLLGRVIALALMLGAAYGVHAIAYGDFACPLGVGSRCEMELPAAAPSPALTRKRAPVEKRDADNEAGEDENAKLEEKAPVVAPATSQ